MIITSHFIGIKINSRIFVDFFVKLQQYLKDHKAEQAIELQNIHSLHITLYYLQDEIPVQERSDIKKTISALTKSHKDLIITIGNIAYFKKAGTDWLGYVECFQAQELTLLNNRLAKKYQKYQILENQYMYIPHISLFRVKNHKLFVLHKEGIDKIIKRQLDKINKVNLFEGFYLFEVNSKFHPEIQFIDFYKETFSISQ